MLESKANHKPKLNRRQAFQAAASALDATFVAGKRRSGDRARLQHGGIGIIGAWRPLAVQVKNEAAQR